MPALQPYPTRGGGKGVRHYNFALPVRTDPAARKSKHWLKAPPGPVIPGNCSPLSPGACVRAPPLPLRSSRSSSLVSLAELQPAGPRFLLRGRHPRSPQQHRARGRLVRGPAVLPVRQAGLPVPADAGRSVLVHLPQSPEGRRSAAPAPTRPCRLRASPWCSSPAAA